MASSSLYARARINQYPLPHTCLAVNADGKSLCKNSSKEGASCRVHHSLPVRVAQGRIAAELVFLSNQLGLIGYATLPQVLAFVHARWATFSNDPERLVRAWFDDLESVLSSEENVLTLDTCCDDGEVHASSQGPIGNSQQSSTHTPEVSTHASLRDDTSPPAKPCQKTAASVPASPFASNGIRALYAALKPLIIPQSDVPFRVVKEDSPDTPVQLPANDVNRVESPTFRPKVIPNSSDWEAFCKDCLATINGKSPTLTEFGVQLRQSHALISNIHRQSLRSSSLNSEEYQGIETRLDEVSKQVATLAIRLDELRLVTFLSLNLQVLLADQLQLGSDY